MGAAFSKPENQNLLALTALAVSLVALVTTVLQVLQQYFSSAEGYRRCAESVMGLWSNGTHRKLRFYEFRIEVVFETPVMFTAPPTNKRGPIKDRDIYYIDGTPSSYEKTRVLLPDAERAAEVEATARVHTADDERASWSTLLSTLQSKESQSRKWDKEMRSRSPPRGRPPIVEPNYRLAVGLQSKTRSWDFIPSSITKPYATSAICHVVEIVAMLGLYWRVFDQTTWNLRAEGNGFILSSIQVHGLGVMFVFATTGKSNFKENRVIPCEEIKEIAFGTVPNIFDEEAYLTRETEAQSLELKFGTPDEEADMLESIGLQAQSLKSYRQDHKHIFSLAFEIIGMLGKVFRIRGSSFRMLPNPTGDYWLKQSGAKASWKITRLMEIFQEKLKEMIEKEGLPENHPIGHIVSQWKKISGLHYPEETALDESNLSIHAREAIHDAIDERTRYLLSLKQSDVLGVVVAHFSKVLEVLADPNSHLNTIVLANKEDALLHNYFHEIRPVVIGVLNHELSKKEKEDRNLIWISLIFRMLCWLLLHDFDKADIKLVPSDLKGSRMPVYIG